MFQVGLQSGTVDQDIIQEHQHKLPQKWTQNVIHQTLKCSWGICEPKRHDLELKMAMMGFKGSFVFI